MRTVTRSAGILLAWLCVPPAHAETVRAVDAQEEIFCRPLLSDRTRLNDYRLRNLTSQARWATADNRQNHVEPARRRMQAGEYSRRVIADLDWTLVLWPNHHVALEALVRYELAGGKTYEFETAPCYFSRARAFAPDDVTTLLTEAYYYWKKGDRPRAKAVYEEALALDPESPDVHYNLGLLYVDLAEFDKAREHARVAYASGYPLPGLRRKLTAAGKW